MRGSILRFKSADFEGAGLFKNHTSVELEKKGLVAILGDEGTGKTTLPEVLTNVIWGQGSPRMVSDKLNERTIANLETGYAATVRFDSGFDAQQRSIEITQAFKHPVHKSKYTIAINGSSKDTPTTKPEQKKLLARIAPISYAEWLGVGYLYQGGTHSLLSGTKTQKRDYLTAVFGLSFWEDLILEAKNESKMFSSFAGQSLDLSSQLATLADEEAAINAAVAKEPDPEEIAQQVADLTTKLQTLSAKVARLSAIATTASQYQEAKEKFSELWPGHEDPDEFRATIVADIKAKKALLKEARASLEAKLVEHTRYVSAKKHAEKAAKNAEEADKALADISQSVGDLPPKEELERCEELLDKASKIGVTPSAAPDGKVVDLSPEEAEDHVRSTKAALDKLLKLKAKLSQDCTCPTCGSKLTDLDDMVASQEKSLAKYRKQAGWSFHKNGAHFSKDEVEIFNEGYRSIANATTKVETATAAWKKAKRDLKETTVVTDDVVASLREEVHTLNEAIEALNHQRDDVDAALAQKNVVTSLSKSLTDVNLDTLNEDKKKAKDRHTKAQEIHGIAMDAKRRVDQATARLASIKEQRSSLEEKVQKVGHLALMADKYEKEIIPYLSALRSARVRERVSVLQGVLPAYLKEMSTHQYEGASMKLVVSDDLEEIDLVMKPSRFNTELQSVQASGGQRRRFTLALLGALREVSPRTSNVMFLDEPFADLQSQGKLLLLNRLLPLMLERCPGLESVFVIAHDREILESSNTSFDDVWRMTNHGEAGSRINTGLTLSKVR